MTGWKIDIKSQSQVEQMIAEGELAAQEDTVADDGFDLDSAVGQEEAFDAAGLDAFADEAGLGGDL